MPAPVEVVFPVRLRPAGYRAEASFTPAAAAYLAGDVMDVAKALAWTDRDGVAFPGGELMIRSVSLLVEHTAVISGETSYQLALYNVTPPSAHADNDAWDLPSGDRAAFLGRVDLGTPVDVGSSLFVATDGLSRIVTVPAAGLYAELITIGAFTATAAVRKAVLHAEALW